MMDEQAIRAQLAEVAESLRRIEDDRQVLLTLQQGFEGWLRLHGKNGHQLSLTEGSQVKKRVSTTIKGTISIRAALLQVLQEANGNPLHSKEIWLRAQALGAVSSGKNPIGLVDLQCTSLGPKGVLKTAPRTWKWDKDAEAA